VIGGHWVFLSRDLVYGPVSVFSCGVSGVDSWLLSPLRLVSSSIISEPDLTADPAPSLKLFDAIALIVGIVVGTAIFKAPAMVFGSVSSPAMGMLLWGIGGALSLVGACCYAELATAYPRSGGDYHYLTAAFGRMMGFLFGWAQLAVILTASIGQMAYIFADYAGELMTLSETASLLVATALVLAITGMNLLGVTTGKSIQNLLTVAKIIGLGGIVIVGLLLMRQVGGVAVGATESTAASSPPAIGLALVFVLYAFGGWNDSAFVAAEVRDPQRNIPRALWIGIILITLVYLLVNLAYLSGLGFDRLRNSSAPAADLVEQLAVPGGKTVISLLVMISAAGAINGMILTGSRVYARLGQDHALFSWLGQWNHRLRTPSRSLIAQAAVAISMIWLVGSSDGRHAIDAVLIQLRISGLPWQDYYGGFETLVAGTAPVFWAFFLSTGIAFFVLRIKDPDTKRPYLVPLYPFLPALFCAMCVYMLYSSLAYAKGLAVIGLLPLVLGIPMFAISRSMDRRRKWTTE